MDKELARIAKDLEGDFKRARRMLSFDEYLNLFGSEPARYLRDAATYLKDAFDYFGTEEIERPWGKMTRYRLFDLAFPDDEALQQMALIGQEVVQSELYRALSNFVREGRPSRVVLLHGPNGSAKSTIARCIMQALEYYSSLDEGALYRFHWVFPTKRTLQGSIGFSDSDSRSSEGYESYAHLPEDQIDARLLVEIRDHPLFLIPAEHRTRLVDSLLDGANDGRRVGDWLSKGSLSHKNREVYEALLASYEGDWRKVLRHVQVERYFISRRYRVGAVTIGPQLSVDAGERQVTADRSLGALPTSLQAITLFEAFGELVEAAGGVLEFSDLLKRPLDAFKYLQLTVETGEVPLRSQNIQLNCVMTASANEVQLAAFREHHEFESFRGRLDLIRVPYLRSWKDEVAIYQRQIVPQIRQHVAPHAAEIAAMFAVLTRMRRPDPSRYDGKMAELVMELTALEKMDLYSTGALPERLDDESRKILRAAIAELYRESDAYAIYEGSIGASPREMRTVLLDAAQNARYEGLSPFAVLEELEELCRERVNDYVWLQQEKRDGGYHDHDAFLAKLRERLLDMLADEVRSCSGMVDDASYRDLFNRYVNHVSYWVKGEKVLNPVTGGYEDPDERLMEEVERLLKSPDSREDFRHSLINSIAARAIDHPDERVEESAVFTAHIRKLRDAVFEERADALGRLCQNIVVLVRDEGVGLDENQRKQAESALAELRQRCGYNDSSAADATGAGITDRP